MLQNHSLLEHLTGAISLQTRRSFLRATTLGLGCFGATGTGSAVAKSSQTAMNRPDTACIVFFLDGGPSHHDTFDPKPKAPAEVRGEFGVIETEVPGIRLCEHLPLLAQQMKHCAILRSLFHGNPSHAPAEHQMLTGWMGSRPGTARAVIEKPSLGSIVSRLRGRRRDGNPAYVAVPWSFHHAYGGSPFGGTAYLGGRYEPLESGHLPKSSTAGYEVPVLKLPEGMPASRLLTRSGLLGKLDQYGDGEISRAALKRSRTLTDEAMNLLVDGRVRQAFDLASEPVALRDRYGAHEWGQGALLSRRLVEAGTTFVMLQCGLRQDWDTHKNNFPALKNVLLPPLDRAVSALIEDLAQRGLLEKTLVIVMGEFGRTPKIGQLSDNLDTEKNGRDHWASVFSALVAGGGLRGGEVVGSSDAIGAYPHERPLHATSLFATMYHVLGINYHTIFHDPQNRPIPVLSHGSPIAELL